MPASHVELGRDYLLKECEIHSDLVVEFCFGFHLKREKVATISAAGPDLHAAVLGLRTVPTN